MVKINKNTISDFADSVPLVALATKSKLFDTSFSSTSELILFHLKTKAQTITKSEHKFCKVKWCEMEEDIFLAAGHEDGFISIYKVVNNNFELIVCKQYMRNNDDIIGIDFFPAKKMICVISNTGKILFLNLTDLKEYFLEINIDSPTCISWNKKVSKILAIGTNKGGVKLVDIKKNSVIISSDGFQTIKNVMWDSNTPTKLLIQSEKQSITEHELSNDLKLEKENYGSEIISFNNEKIVISEFIIDVNTNAKFPIPLSTSVSLGKNHACLHLKDGTTEILSIPKLPVRKGFFRIENKIFTGKNVFVVGAEHVVDEENTGNEDVDSSFYDNLKDQKGTEIYKFLIENASSIPPCFQGKHTENKISVDLDNKEHLALVTGDFSVLKNCKEKVEIGFLVSLLNNDTSAVSKATSFSQLIIMSKLLNNYSMLTKISNSRVLAAIILCNNLDINILNETDREGKIIKGILTNDNSIISDRIVLNDNFYQNLGKIKKYLGGLSSPIESDYLSEYFWFMVAQGKYEEVKNLCVNDLLINNYKESKNVVCAFKNVHVSRNSNNFPNSQQGNFISQKSAVKSFSPATGRIQQPSGASPKAPLGMQSQQPAFPRTHQMSPSPKPMNTPVNQTPQSALVVFHLVQENPLE
ncbi:sec31 [Ecytonucleospora hepatopenaei]|uniref:Sec31 n=1 Tax=Ecytonucleospora hepatopenaei TaxID=646526 RepID=A0A1W0E722_9MICR|nr:sec31 [Ecytonucleospora hepatopenaei]